MPIRCVVSDKLQIFKTIKSRYLGISFQIIEILYKSENITNLYCCYIAYMNNAVIKFMIQTTAQDEILISCQPILKLTTN
jgi:hypothetical protein